MKGNKSGKFIPRSRRGLQSAGAKRRSQQSQSFDPRELTRRLDAYLLEQNLKVSQRRSKLAAQRAKDGLRPLEKTRWSLGQPSKPDLMASNVVDHFDCEVVQKGNQRQTQPRHNETGGPISFRVQFNGPEYEASRLTTSVGADKQSRKDLHVEDVTLSSQIGEGECSHDVEQQSDVVHTPRRRFLIPSNITHQNKIPKSTMKYHTRQRPNERKPHAQHDRQDWAQRDEAPSEAHRTLKKWVKPVLKLTSSIKLANHRDDSRPRRFLFWTRS